MWKITIAIVWMGFVVVSHLPQDPYNPHVSCPDGHIVATLADCPPTTLHRAPGDPPIGGGPHRSGLLGLGIGGIL